MKRIWMVLLLGALACAENVNKIVPVRNLDANQLESRLSGTLGPTGVRMSVVQNNIVLSGPDQSVASAEQLIKLLDTPKPAARNVEVSGYIILASHEGAAAGGAGPDLEPVLKQFRSILPYKSFRVLDTIVLRGLDNQFSVSRGVLPLEAKSGNGEVKYEFRTRPTIGDDAIHLSPVNLNVDVPRLDQKSQVYYMPVSISTEADIKPGQKVAIGKASVDSAGDALILVVSAKVVD